MSINNLTVQVDTEQLEQTIERLEYAKQLINELNEGISLAEVQAQNVNSECFYTVDDVMELTGYSRPTVLNMFKMKSFPACSMGKRKIVKKSAFWKFFDEPIVGNLDL